MGSIFDNYIEGAFVNAQSNKAFYVRLVQNVDCYLLAGKPPSGGIDIGTYNLS